MRLTSGFASVGTMTVACTAINEGQLGCRKQLESECVAVKAALEQVGLEGPTSGDIKVMPTILFSWVMLSIVVGVAADGRGRNPAWFLLALMISPLLAALLLLALPNLKTKRQWQPFIQAVIGWSRSRPCNSKGTTRMSTFAAATLTADRIDYWIRRHVISVLGRNPSLSTQVESRTRSTRWAVSNWAML